MLQNLTVDNLIFATGIYFGLIFLVTSLAIVIWTARDIRARTRDNFNIILSTLLVLGLNLPGLLIYLFLRPRETLSEAYERSLEEEALLQEIEGKPTCPGCGQRVKENWQACPQCHTRLKKPCIACGEMLHLSWNMCPICATIQSSGVEQTRSAHASRRIAKPTPTQNQWESSASSRTTPTDSQVTFIDESY
ncbi:MAG: zinc ribbon domain-containing protein [Phototrophicaceae bacterium]